MRTLAWLSLLFLAGCALFEPRTPEPPDGDSGSFVQPDTPDLVIQNVISAVGEQRPAAYRASFSDDFRFVPTAEAAARDGFWSSWSRFLEESTFRTLISAAQPGATFVLRLDEAQLDLAESRAIYQARYTLSVPHRRVGVPTAVAGRLQWVILRGDDGLWAIAEWSDQVLPGVPSWSDLKAGFFR